MAIRRTPGSFYGEQENRCEVGDITIAETRIDTGTDLPQHRHENAHFCMVLRGDYTERCPGWSADRSRGDLTFYPAGLIHAETYRTSGCHLMVDVGPWVTSDITGAAPSSTVVLNGTEAIWLAGRLHRELRDPDDVSPLAIRGLVLEMVATAFRVEDRNPGRAPPWLAGLDDLLRETFADPPSLAEMAAALGVHRSHLTRTYRRFRHRTIGDRIRELRVAFASTRLLETDDPLAQISAASGFADQSHLTRAFKVLTGVTPGQYRRSAR